MQQRSLFPDAFEIQARARSALRTLDTAAALAFVRSARAMDPRLVDLDHLEHAIAWLHRRIGERAAGTCTVEDLAGLLVEVVPAVLADELTRESMGFVDEVVSARLRTIDRGEATFVDVEQRVPWGLVLRLGRNSLAEARKSLQEALRGIHANRADLWGWLGDLCVLEGRKDEGNAAYVRALLFEPERVDFARLVHPGLLGCRAELASLAPGEAGAALFTEAWLCGALSVPRGNGWVAAAEVERLLRATPAAAESPSIARQRRFALLVYADRSMPECSDIIERRMELADLVPATFERYMAVCRRNEAR